MNHEKFSSFNEEQLHVLPLQPRRQNWDLRPILLPYYCRILSPTPPRLDTSNQLADIFLGSFTAVHKYRYFHPSILATVHQLWSYKIYSQLFYL